MIIVDTNFWDAALRSPSGASHLILRNVLTGSIEAGASTTLFLEYEDVLKRPDHLRVSKLSVEQVDIVLSALAQKLEPIHIHYKWRPMLKEPLDEIISIYTKKVIYSLAKHKAFNLTQSPFTWACCFSAHQEK